MQQNKNKIRDFWIMIANNKNTKIQNVKCMNDRQIQHICYYQMLSKRSQFVTALVNNNAAKKKKVQKWTQKHKNLPLLTASS